MTGSEAPSGIAPGLSSREDAELRGAVLRMGLAEPGEPVTLVALTGGVSSLIARAEAGGRVFCVKAALSRLRVAADWQVPVARNRFEVAWMRAAACAVPGSAPDVLADDPVGNSFAMSWLDPATHPVWKAELLAGRVSAAVAAALGGVVGRIHAATADRADVARDFATDDSFHAIRLEPYLVQTARVNPDLSDALHGLAARTAATRRALVHGDVSPKNILAGPNGPVVLDAECAWFGDPAFDVAFCLNHLALKAVHRPADAGALRNAAEALWAGYAVRVTWEDAGELEGRVASLLPALALARVDGKSPVEYLSAPGRAAVRHAARGLVRDPPATLAHFNERWERACR